MGFGIISEWRSRRDLPSIDHVTINSFANAQLALRCGVAGTVIPNVMDFENPPPPPDDYTSDVRQAFGIEDDELFILQPTRVVARKGIEMAIELVSRLGKKAKLVISHASGDEGYDYQNRLKEYSEFLNVNTIFVDDIIDEQRGLLKMAGRFTRYQIFFLIAIWSPILPPLRGSAMPLWKRSIFTNRLW